MTPSIQSGATYGAYHRVSRTNGRDMESDSVMTERVAFEQIGSWAKLRGVKVIQYLDRDQSGSKLSRPAFDQMLADLRDGKIDGIAVAQVDRLSRADVGDALNVVKQILDIAPGKLVLLDLGIDPTTEFGEFGLTILLGLARMQWRRYKRQWETAQSRAVARGVWIGGVPFGYSADEDTKLVPDENAPTVAEAFRVAARDGVHAATDYLRSAAPDRRWELPHTRRLLGNRAYLGEQTNGALENLTDHEPLTTLTLFNAAQTEPRARRSNGAYPLAGLVRCGTCGGNLTGGETRHKLADGETGTYRRMRCQNKQCSGHAGIDAGNLEAHVFGLVRDGLGRDAFRHSFAPVGIEAAREALEVAESERVAFASDLEARQILGADAWRAGATARTAAVDRARAEFQTLASQASHSETLPLPDQLDDPEQLLRAASILIDRIDVAKGRLPIGERVEVVWNGLDSDDVARPELAA